MAEEWMDQLREVARGVRPVGDVAGPIAGAVRRRRRRRTALTCAAAAAVVAVAAVGVAALPEPDRRAEPAEPPAFTCAENRIFTESPPLADLAAQREVVARLEADAAVRHAEPTALGVLVLVDGLTPEIEDRLRDQGADVVREWEETYADEDLGAEEHVMITLNDEIRPTLREVAREVKGIPGYAGIGYWRDAGAVLLQWKAPVPPEVAALAGVGDGGVQVVVDPVPYSERDVEAAMRRLPRSVGDDRVSASSPCGDFTGLEVLVVPPIADETALEEQLAERVGMPVRVEPGEVVSLAGVADQVR